VGAWGEERLIAGIRQWLGSAGLPPPAGIGDDCAVLPTGSRLITVDPVVFGRHFDESVPARHVGAKLLKRNLSDIAAMGGAPTVAVVGLLLSPNVRVTWLEQFYRGLAATARQYDVAIVGGDISEVERDLRGALAGTRANSQPTSAASAPGGRAPPTFSAHLTLLGNPTGKRILTRSGAGIGDYLYVTGVLGGSLASGHHYKFQPRLAEGAWFASRGEVTAMMDVSDGLAKDVHALEPSGGAASLFAAALPLRKGVTLEAALTDGEDYELLLAVNPAADLWQFEAAFAGTFPRVPLTRIGQFMPHGKSSPGAILLEGVQGYEHLR